MSPNHKEMLVIELQKLRKSEMIAMCGDGANDCKALKSADVGLSLSEAEASIAAPFTSKIQNISPMIKLLREGRASIVTSFQVFKFMALYAMIQFTSTIILYNYVTNLGNYQYLFIDLFIVIPLSFSMSRTSAYPKLSKKLPIGHLISKPVLITIFIQIVIQILGQVAIFLILINEPWFEPLDPVEGEFNILCYENSAIFLNSLVIYVSMVFVFNIGKPFRKPMWTNPWLIISIVLLLVAIYLMILVSC